MTNLKRAHNELYRRGEDETFDSLTDLALYVQGQKERSRDRWVSPNRIRPNQGNTLMLELGHDGVFRMNDWSFTQLCQLAKVSRDTVNKLTPETANRVFQETLPQEGNKPLQVFTEESMVRSLHLASYTRLHNADVVAMLQEFAVDFKPPQQATTGGTGLYAGEQDMFCFLIDPLGWAEIDGEAFAPGFFVWNSEVGKRSVGIQTFWFQAVCQNHIVWDAVEVVELTRKHTAKVGGVLDEIRQTIESLVAKRDARRDGFVRLIKKAMESSLGLNAEVVLKVLTQRSISRSLAMKALDIAKEKGRFTVFSLVDALTRLAGEMEFAGDRTEIDHKAAGLLTLAA